MTGWDPFENCTWANYKHENDTELSLEFQRTTAEAELAGTTVSFLAGIVYFVLLVYQRVETRNGTQPSRSKLSWDKSQRVQSLAVLCIAYTAVFLISAPSAFRPWNQTHARCTTQGTLYQLTYFAIMMEPLAMALNSEL